MMQLGHTEVVPSVSGQAKAREAIHQRSNTLNDENCPQRVLAVIAQPRQSHGCWQDLEGGLQKLPCCVS